MRSIPYTEKKTFRCGEVELMTYTKGEARALFKKKLGISKKGRLPVGVEISKIRERSDP